MARPSRRIQKQPEPARVELTFVWGICYEGTVYGPGYPEDTAMVDEVWAKRFQERGCAHPPGSEELAAAQEKFRKSREALKARTDAMGRGART